MEQHLQQLLEHAHITPEVVADATKAMHDQLENGEFGAVSTTKKRKVTVTYRKWELSMDCMSFQD
eukprot:1330300-Amphidinium_carterae.1